MRFAWAGFVGLQVCRFTGLQAFRLSVLQACRVERPNKFEACLVASLSAVQFQLADLHQYVKYQESAAQYW